jgi:hypothetical protein
MGCIMPPEALAASPASFDHARAWMDVPPRTGWEAFDDLRLLSPGRAALFDVAPEALPAARRLLAGFLAGGVGARGRAVLVEAQAPFVDAPALAEAAEGLGLRPAAVLAGVRVARVREPARLGALLEDGFPGLPAAEPVGAVVVADLPEAFVAGRRQGLRDRDALSRALAWLKATARLHDAPLVLATCILSRRPSRALRDALLEAVDEAVSLHPAPPDGLRIRVPGRGVSLLAGAPL